MRTVTIGGKVWKCVYNLKGLFVYEEMAGHPYKGEKTIDTYMLLYAMLIANTEGFAMEFDELIEACDGDMNIYQTFVEVMNDEAKRVNAFQENKKKAMMQ